MKKIQYNNLVLSYAMALFFISKSDLDSIKVMVKFLLNCLRDSKYNIFTYLSYSGISTEYKKKILLSVNNKLCEKLVNFIVIIIINRRSFLLIPILEKFLSIIAENELEITINSVKPLKEYSLKAITDSLHFVGKIKKVNNVIDNSILGGIVIKYGFNLIDLSLKSYLNNLLNLTKEVLK